MTKFIEEEIEFYGYSMLQTPSNIKLTIYCGAIEAKKLRDAVSVDNAVSWDKASVVWKDGGRNRTIIDKHVSSIEEFLSSGNSERILPSAIVMSVDDDSLSFEPFSKMASIDGVTPGLIKFKVRYVSDGGRRTVQRIRNEIHT